MALDEKVQDFIDTKISDLKPEEFLKFYGKTPAEYEPVNLRVIVWYDNITYISNVRIDTGRRYTDDKEYFLQQNRMDEMNWMTVRKNDHQSENNSTYYSRFEDVLGGLFDSGERWIAKRAMECGCEYVVGKTYELISRQEATNLAYEGNTLTGNESRRFMIMAGIGLRPKKRDT